MAVKLCHGRTRPGHPDNLTLYHLDRDVLTSRSMTLLVFLTLQISISNFSVIPLNGFEMDMITCDPLIIDIS